MNEASKNKVDITFECQKIINHKVHAISVEFLTFTTLNVTLGDSATGNSH